jgi:uracil-DNA glycosylase
MIDSIASAAERLAQWHQYQKEIAECKDCCQRWTGEVTRPLAIGEIPEPPETIDILFVGVAPTPAQGPYRGAHFYSNSGDLLRRGLFKLLSHDEFGIQLLNLDLDEGNRKFHGAGLFFVHTTKVRPVTHPAPPTGTIKFCSLRHLGKEITVLAPRALCFLGRKNASAAAHALFGKWIGEEPEYVALNGWSGVAAVADQPRRGWEKRTRIVLRTLWQGQVAAGTGDQGVCG